MRRLEHEWEEKWAGSVSDRFVPFVEHVVAAQGNR
jgi:hypothetical protein